MELRETPRAVTPFGGLVVFFEFLRRVCYGEAVRQHLPFRLTSPNATDPVETFTAFLLAVVAGARRFAHASLLRADVALHELLGIARFPADDTIRDLFKRFGQGQCQRFFSGLWNWQLQRLPECSSGYSLDLDSTVFERYGQQQGALRGPNPRKHGRPSHHPLVAVLAEAHFLLHGWLRSGNCGTARGVVEFLKEALALLPEQHALRVMRADAGFFEQQLLGFLEQRGLSYMENRIAELKHDLAADDFWEPTCSVRESTCRATDVLRRLREVFSAWLMRRTGLVSASPHRAILSRWPQEEASM